MKWLRLKHQLKRQQAKKTEAQELSGLAKQLSRMDLPALDNEAKKRIATEAGFRAPRYPRAFRYSMQALLILIVATLVSAQYSEPGTALYGVKEQTNRLHSALHERVPLLPPPDKTGKDGDNSGRDSEAQRAAEKAREEAKEAAEERAEQAEDRRDDVKDAREDAAKEAEDRRDDQQDAQEDAVKEAEKRREDDSQDAAVVLPGQIIRLQL